MMAMRLGSSLVLTIGLVACSEQLSEEASGVVPPIPLPAAFTGLWANSFTDCSLSPGTAEAAPVEITPTTMTGYENSCAISDVQLTDDGQTAGVLRTCEAEGMTYEDEVVLRVNRDTLLLIPGEGPSVTWTRCPPQTPTEE